MSTKMLCSAFFAAFLYVFSVPVPVVADTAGRPKPEETIPPASPIDGTRVHQTRGPGHWQPGGYEARVGSPYFYSGGGRSSFVVGTWAPAYGLQAVYGPYGSGPGFGAFYPHSPDPYTQHFGPGFYRHIEYGHHRFPYYSYRRPWYFPGQPVYTRDTNFAW